MNCLYTTTKTLVQKIQRLKIVACFLNGFRLYVTFETELSKLCKLQSFITEPTTRNNFYVHKTGLAIKVRTKTQIFSALIIQFS